jgi:hypothetical protein
MATTRLHRTPGSGSGNKWTVSTWVKMGITGTNEILFSGDTGGSFEFRTYVEMQSSGVIKFAGVDNGNNNGYVTTHGMFRDPNAWYHLVFVWDDANASSADKMKMYINGERMQGTGGIAYLAPTTQSRWNTANNNEIGARHSGADRFFTGVMAHFYNCDGYAYQASDFGETDATSGAWIAKSSPSVSYGTNGFFLKFASGAFGTDSSGQGNNFTVVGTMTTTKDTPDDNYCTINELANYWCSSTFSNGNNTIATVSGNTAFNLGSMSVTKGKWYWETLVQAGGSQATIGITTAEPTSSTNDANTTAWGYSYYGSNGQIYRSNSGTAYGNSYTTGDYIGTYLDLDNLKIYFSKNGTLQNSGTGHTILDPSTFSVTNCNRRYAPMVGDNHTGTSYTLQTNFGNGCFGSTQLTGTTYSDAGGKGTFKYNMAGTFDGS